MKPLGRKTGSSPWPGYEPLYLARDLGYLKEASVRITELPTSNITLEAFSNGSADVATLTLDEVLTLLAHGYSNQFAQVILNILANAKEAIQHRMAAGGWIKVRLRCTDDRGVLEIEDNGGGIPEAVRPKIFDPYFSTKEKGSGIGLYMSKMITERNLSGTIEASNAEQGALITIALPLLHRQPPSGA